jgi:hypothetical protein
LSIGDAAAGRWVSLLSAQTGVNALERPITYTIIKTVCRGDADPGGTETVVHAQFWIEPES